VGENPCERTRLLTRNGTGAVPVALAFPGAAFAQGRPSGPAEKARPRWRPIQARVSAVSRGPWCIGVPGREGLPAVASSQGNEGYIVLGSVRSDHVVHDVSAYGFGIVGRDGRA